MNACESLHNLSLWDPRDEHVLMFPFKFAFVIVEVKDARAGVTDAHVAAHERLRALLTWVQKFESVVGRAFADAADVEVAPARVDENRMFADGGVECAPHTPQHGALEVLRGGRL